MGVGWDDMKEGGLVQLELHLHIIFVLCTYKEQGTVSQARPSAIFRYSRPCESAKVTARL